MGTATERRRLHHCHLGADLGQQRHEVLGRVMRRVQQHVEQRELDLPQRLQPALEVACRQHLVEEGPRQRLAGIDMRCHVFEDIPLPAEVLHELARQLHGVPLDAADARDIALVDLGQHVVQAMAEFVKQRGDVVMREQRRFAIDTLGEVAHKVGHRRLQVVVVGAQPAGPDIVHPGAATLAAAGRGIEVELADQLRGAASRIRNPLDPVKLHAGVPYRRLIASDRDLEQRLDDLEQAGQHLGCREVLLDLLFAERVTLFLELLADV